MAETSPPPTWITTPLIESDAISKVAGCRVFLKLENLQPSGSFKSRGIGNLIRSMISKHPPGMPLHFYSSSGGNAGLACVAAATRLGYKSSVVVPLTTKPMMIEKIRIAGATKVIQHGVTWKEADTHLREVILATDATGVYIPPFDHEDIWTGNATMITEIDQQLGGQPDVIVCSVGGGGLFCGIMQGVSSHPSQSTQVIAVETHGADSLHQAVEAGHLITLPGITSIATSLGATQVCAQALHYGLQSNVKTVVVTDQEAIDGCVRLVNDERVLVEPACGASVIMGYGKLREIIPDLTEESKVVIVICGGSNVNVQMISQWSEQYSIDSS